MKVLQMHIRILVSLQVIQYKKARVVHMYREAPLARVAVPYTALHAQPWCNASPLITGASAKQPVSSLGTALAKHTFSSPHLPTKKTHEFMEIAQ
jgi:hypothetical protein